MRIRDSESKVVRMVCGVNEGYEMTIHTIPRIIVKALVCKCFTVLLL